MSKWLSSVNQFLEKLDDQVEETRENFRVQQHHSSDSLEDEYYSDEEYYSEEEEGFVNQYEHESPKHVSVENAQGDTAPLENIRSSSPVFVQNQDVSLPADLDKTPSDPKTIQNEPSNMVGNGSGVGTSLSSENLDSMNPSEVDTKSNLTAAVAEAPISLLPAAYPANVSTSADAVTDKTKMNIAVDSSSVPVSRPSHKRGSREEVHSSSKANHQHLQRLEKENASLQEQLKRCQKELQAQHEELQQAAEQIKEERMLLDEEKEDMVLEQQEEISTLRQQYESRIQQIESDAQARIEEMKRKLKQETEQRKQQDGNYSKEIKDAFTKQEESAQTIDRLHKEKIDLESQLGALKETKLSLQQQLQSLQSSYENALQKEQAAEAMLDSVQEQHQKQLAQRQMREAELERTVAQLSATVVAANATNSNPSMDSNSSETYAQQQQALSEIKGKYEEARDEAEALQGQLLLLNQQNEALTKELHDINQERLVESGLSQKRQREYEERISSMNSQIHRLEKLLQSSTLSTESSSAAQTANSEATVQQLTRELDNAKQRGASLSDQLLRQQGIAEAAKAEVLTLKERLQSANNRVEEAERALSNGSNPYEVESGDVPYSGARLRRRVKGGGRMHRRHTTPSRAARVALGMQATNNGCMEQIASTLDAFDAWMLDVGSILREEPLARVGLAFYFILVHLWAFCLIAFHAVEAEHGDLGTLTSRRAFLDHTQHGPLHS